MNDVKKFTWAFLIGMLIRAYTTVVALNLWNWFAVDAFHAATISFWGMYGLLMLVDLLLERPQQSEREAEWQGLYSLIDLCIPQDKQQTADEAIKRVAEEAKAFTWIQAGLQAFGKVIGNTITLAAGFFIHSIAS
jgi:hypothetical protein